MTTATLKKRVGKRSDLTPQLSTRGDCLKEDTVDRESSTVFGVPRACAEHNYPALAITRAAGKEDAECERFDNPYSAPKDAIALVEDALASGENPLAEPARRLMEPRFNRDFGDECIYTGTEASASARSGNSMAYTVGDDIILREGYKERISSSGKWLLANELSHAIQQRGSVKCHQSRFQWHERRGEPDVSSLQSHGITSQADDPYQVEPDSIADATMQSETPNQTEQTIATNISSSRRIDIQKQEATTMPEAAPNSSEAPPGASPEANSSNPPQDYTVQINVGGTNAFEGTIPQAVKQLIGYIRAEEETFESLQKQKEEAWIVGFWSEWLGHADILSQGIPGTIESTLSALSGVVISADKGNMDDAERRLVRAVGIYNRLQREMKEYVEAIGIGGEKAVTILEVTITVLSTAVTGGASGAIGNTAWSAGTRFAANAGVEAGLAAFTESMKQYGSVRYGLESKVNINEIIGAAGASLAGSVVSGSLNKLFAGRLAAHMAGWPQFKGATIGEIEEVVCAWLFDEAGTIVEQSLKATMDALHGKELMTWDRLFDLLMSNMFEMGCEEGVSRYIQKNPTKFKWAIH